MKLVRYTHHGRTRLGKVVDSTVIDLSEITGIDHSMRQLLNDLPALRERLERVAGPAIALEEVRLEAPIHDPQKFLGIGMNYRQHAEEARRAGIAIPSSQMWFNKQVSCISGPFDPVVKPRISEQMDYEIELGVVIGRRCRHVCAGDAPAVIAGYLIVNDLSARDWLKKSPTFTLGKSFDTHGPLGPWLTTCDEIADPLALQMTLTVNGEQRQHASTGDMIYNIYQQIEYLSSVMTLEPGDVLATGTPSGIGAPTGRFLQPGDLLHLTIDGLGAIEHRVVAEDDAIAWEA
ncbi:MULTISPECIES: fumarylacetoacetate hydrolase family protein [Raoultella]|jgi:2-keto-4-pentenoate hydratase/2-oxohepta-3-ene-1,7-dioic acid hydratase in catechol pathway|uniref:Fumarylacetoacetate hydrolase family protein n=1 Tax=Raoultella planticola TaxID=575 RepID=A0A443VJZ8_RAOPL|nr:MULTISPECIES: fumarylacetoacetate hydrolase family protein [Raoultella]AUV53691.1 5-carboxymethyl-2-hydroxymuconate isomerase [Raoultella planticola]EKW3529281.1 fumarylacetoacetate hydrolase family protein [Raoultella planticola]ELC3574201.1 fumarylacetoacetate hydrolase family protein [Raoultella planticola]ELF4969314.1 fumarylacetoacetate hydrolase family protein [Raoultella planticola]ELH7938349.1 fumarylacetoacetate hydrolase family protein [Raoultella planticola]